MMRKIGFSAEIKEDGTEKDEYTLGFETVVPKRSVVQVGFAGRSTTLAYYNDKFDLKCGDLVYVDGKLEGKLGRVTEVNYNFKIKLSDYKRVISVVDTAVNGQLFMAGTYSVAFERDVIPTSKVRAWFKAPKNDDEEIVSGSDDSSFFLNDLSGMNVTNEVAERGNEYYCDNKVSYICVDKTKGYAIVEGREAYEVEFELCDGAVRNLVCSCFCSYNCKHSFAAMLQLREILELICSNYEEEYRKTDYFAAIRNVILFTVAVDGKERGSFTMKTL
jgi:hypothetical protein